MDYTKTNDAKATPTNPDDCGIKVFFLHADTYAEATSSRTPASASKDAPTGLDVCAIKHADTYTEATSSRSTGSASEATPTNPHVYGSKQCCIHGDTYAKATSAVSSGI